MTAAAVFLLATARESIGVFLGVYIALMWGYFVTQLIAALGGGAPYPYKWSSAYIGFLRVVCEPFVGLFRRFIPPIGPVDLSTIVALLVLFFSPLLIALIRGG